MGDEQFIVRNVNQNKHAILGFYSMNLVSRSKNVNSLLLTLTLIESSIINCNIPYNLCLNSARVP